MEILPFAIVGLICIVIGYILASLMRGFAVEETQEKSDQPPPEGRVEVARLWRRDQDNEILAELDGKTFESAADLNADEHARLSLALVDLYAWLEKSSRPAPQLEDHQLTTSESQKEPSEPTARTVPPELPSPAIQAPRPVSPHGEIAPPSLNPIKSLMSLARKEAADKIMPQQRSIAEQVDEILQEKLVGSSLEDQGIRLMELPGKGMVILVGLDQYADLDAVPNEEIRAIIRSAVADWEARERPDDS